MLTWIRDHTGKFLLVVTLMITIGCFFVFTETVSSYLQTSEKPARVIDRLERTLRKDPYEPAVLLESARSHYEMVRNSLRENGKPPEELHSIMREGLSQYRRLIANSQWNLDRRDFFYAAYLYFKLGRPYYDRARSLALKSYQQGYRSRPLITLLANIEYQQANSKKDYKVALNYYDSLGPNLMDPVLLYNKAQTLRQLEKFDRASKILKRGRRFLESYSSGDNLRSKYRVARVRLNVQQGQFEGALSFIRSIPSGKRSLKLRTLFARCLVETGRINRARTELRELVDQPESPSEAERLLNDISRNPKKTRS